MEALKIKEAALQAKIDEAAKRESNSELLDVDLPRVGAGNVVGASTDRQQEVVQESSSGTTGSTNSTTTTKKITKTTTTTTTATAAFVQKKQIRKVKMMRKVKKVQGVIKTRKVITYAQKQKKKTWVQAREQVHIVNIVVLAGPPVVVNSQWYDKFKGELGSFQADGIHIHFSVIGFGEIHPSIHRLPQLSVEGTFLHAGHGAVDAFRSHCETAIIALQRNAECYRIQIEFDNGQVVNATLKMGPWHQRVDTVAWRTQVQKAKLKAFKRTLKSANLTGKEWEQHLVVFEATLPSIIEKEQKATRQMAFAQFMPS